MTPAKFWVVYAVCCIVGLSVLEPMLAHLLWGHPGDQVVGGFVVASAAVVTAVVGVACGTLLRRLRPAYGFSIAAATGLAAFLPAYAVLYLFF